MRLILPLAGALLIAGAAAAEEPNGQWLFTPQVYLQSFSPTDGKYNAVVRVYWSPCPGVNIAEAFTPPNRVKGKDEAIDAVRVDLIALNESAKDQAKHCDKH